MMCSFSSIAIALIIIEFLKFAPAITFEAVFVQRHDNGPCQSWRYWFGVIFLNLLTFLFTIILLYLSLVLIAQVISKGPIPEDGGGETAHFVRLILSRYVITLFAMFVAYFFSWRFESWALAKWIRHPFPGLQAFRYRVMVANRFTFAAPLVIILLLQIFEPELIR